MSTLIVLAGGTTRSRCRRRGPTVTAMCTCAQGCSRNSLADPGVFPDCRCWCHDFPGPHTDSRCCGDHPGDWEHPAEPGHSFCRECLDRLGGIAGAGAK